MGLFIIYVVLNFIDMSLNKKNIKLKIVELDKEIKFLEKKIIEITWQRAKYVQFYEKINEHKGF